MTTSAGTTGTGRELRISFRQHDGEMLGRCWCGRTWTSGHPREMWDWLDDHEHAPAASGDGRGDRDGD
ncbi:hypothetical protein [Pseudonocardia sp.]|uniref:hypothetical protein n=1 Tax=Pseudonocardia sp. TaxID=60912 RepID=UPI0031FE4263